MINIYCDESCHLENDNSNVMVLGGIQVDNNFKRNYYHEIREIKSRHSMSTWNEIKWTKVSNSKINFYIELIDWFFSREVFFRGLVAQNKKELNHSIYSDGDYDLWYYKMYFRLIDPLLEWGKEYKIFIDIKDTRGGNRIRKLDEVLSNNMYDFNGDVLKDVQQIQSHQSELLQVCDLIIGALSYYHRGLYDSYSPSAKNRIIEHLLFKHQINFDNSSYRSEKKFNLFIWTPQGVR